MMLWTIDYVLSETYCTGTLAVRMQNYRRHKWKSKVAREMLGRLEALPNAAVLLYMSLSPSGTKKLSHTTCFDPSVSHRTMQLPYCTVYNLPVSPSSTMQLPYCTVYNLPVSPSSTMQLSYCSVYNLPVSPVEPCSCLTVLSIICLSPPVVQRTKKIIPWWLSNTSILTAPAAFINCPSMCVGKCEWSYSG